MRHRTSEELWISDLAVDIHSYLRKREKERFPVRGVSRQLHLRPRLVEFLNLVCCQKMLCVPVQHLAAYLLDAFLEENLIEEEHWQLFVLGCLSVAAKLEENDDLIPSNKDLCSLLDGSYIPLDIMHAEMCTLKHFEWDVLLPTAAHFAEYYELYAALPLVDGLHLQESDYKLLKKCIRAHIDYFLLVVLEDIRFYSYSPSMIAASCIASSRLHLELSPSWPHALRNITQYQLKELKPCIDMLMSELDNDKMNAKCKTGRHQSLKQKWFHISRLSKSEGDISCI